MKLEDYREIVACLEGERVLYHYYPDRYAFLLLGWAAEAGADLKMLRASRFNRLLQKPSVRECLMSCGDARVDPALFHDYWLQDTRQFVLGLDSWSHQQTSRSDAQSYNLVLQLNFSREHMQDVNARFGRTDLFNYNFHPVQNAGDKKRRETLAWARIDLDFATDTALIEEVQSDWVSALHWALQHGWWVDDRKFSKEFLGVYCEEALGWVRHQWSDAMLAATLQFIRLELGISQIFYHTWEGGNLLKRLDGTLPPKSLYTKLPQRFCMTRTSDVPEFLFNDRRLRRLFRVRPDIEFYRFIA